MNLNKLYNWINYYRNSLADGEMLDIRTKDCEEGNFFNTFEDLNPDNLQSVYEKYYKTIKRNKSKSKSDEEEEQKFPIDIFISPFFLNPPNVHGKKPDNFKTVYPYWIPATLNPTGEVTVSSEESKLPWFMRSVLEPVYNDTGYIPIISSVEKVDKTLDSFHFNNENWEEYWKSAEEFFIKVTGSGYNKYKLEDYNTINSICIIKAKNVVAAQNILRVYDDLKISPSVPNLLTKLLDFGKLNRNSIPDSKYLFLKKGHYGQYNNQYPLSTSQRKSLLIFEQDNSGEILAVNGPPGTGKTTLLQSIVANEIVKSAIKGNEPPKIVASSTNNQAITNILDSFESGKDSIDRWIPIIKSLGSYLISSDTAKQEEATKKGYQILTRSFDKIDGYYFKDIINLDTNEVEQHFIESFSKEHGVSPNISIEEIVRILKNKVESEAKKIDEILQVVSKFYQAETENFPLSNLPEFKRGLEQLANTLELLESEKKSFIAFRNRYDQFTEKNRLQIFFSFIGSIKKSYNRKLSIFLIDSPTPLLKNQTSNRDVETILLDSLRSIDEQIPPLKDEINSKHKLYNNLIKIQADYQSVKKELSNTWQEFLKTKKPSERESIEHEFNQLEFFEQANRVLDISLRYTTFINALHYWEGLWIVQRQKEESAQHKVVTKRNTFSQISYLTPLFISTFHSLPGFCSKTEKTTDNDIKKPIYELFDLLIVDEAGQVSPEVGVASFSFARRALVVGDTHQIEPVWNISFEKVDKGNLKENKLLANSSFDELKNLGVLCSSGSLMNLAQNASAYEVNSKMGGTILTEHRRCVDELVEFSNEFVYENMLIPKIGKLKDDERRIKYKEIDLTLPPLSYINVRGYSEKRMGSSYNSIEAQAIAKWISKYGEAIVNHFNKGKSDDKKSEIKDCIAVVTPFAEQKKEIYHFFEEHGIDKQITVGTVHALQGAERPLVIFSPTYGTNNKSGQLFFDSGYNMLNVALTRAKKHFVVIGNMSLFNPKNKQRPSGGLAKYLFASELNELSSSFLYNEQSIDIKSRVDSLEKHQRCLSRVFEVAKERIIIVSPFISINAIESDAIAEKIDECTKKNIKVTIFTDKFLDMPYGKMKPASLEGRNALFEAGADIRILNGIHNKALVKDEDLLVEGSFNWLSAIRDTKHPHYRFDVSHIIQDSEAKKQIEKLLEEMGKFEEG